jgi:phenylalanyl-tRNA synthetase beta chain
VDLFDVYEGRGVPDGRRSLAVALVFRAPERTLTDAEVDEAQAAIVGALEREHDVVLRSGG